MSQPESPGGLSPAREAEKRRGINTLTRAWIVFAFGLVALVSYFVLALHDATFWELAPLMVIVCISLFDLLLIAGLGRR